METMQENDENIKSSDKRINKTILDNFSNLIKPHEGIRIKSSVHLLKYLCGGDFEKVRYYCLKLQNYILIYCFSQMK